MSNSLCMWLFILALGVVDGVFMLLYEMSAFIPASNACIIMVMVVALIYIGNMNEKGGRAELSWVCLSVVLKLIIFSSAIGAFSYIVLTLNRPLVDDIFDHADKVIGFDWVAWFNFVQSSQILKTVLELAYGSLLIQVIAAVFYLCITQTDDDRSRFLWSVIISLTITVFISGIFPAESAWAYYGVVDYVDAYHLNDFNSLRNGSMRELNFGAMNGLVTFPSYHTALPILIIRSTLKCKILFSALVIDNIFLFMSVPPCGGHYLVDMMGGVIVAVVSIVWSSKITCVLAHKTAVAAIVAHEPV